MLRQDIRHALRSLLRDRGVTAIVLACLGLGIGINATLFSVIDGVLIQALPFAEADRLVLLNETFQRGGIRRGSASYLDFQDWKSHNTSFADIAATTTRSLALSDGGEPERVQGALVSWNLFPLLGIPPQLGRQFGPEDDRAGAEPVVMLSDEIWHRRYGGDQSILGRAVSVNGRPHTVIGVMPPRFAFPENHRAWIPLAPIAEPEARSARNLMAIGRLKPGVDLVRARTDMNAVAAGLAADYPLTNDGWGVLAQPLADAFTPDEIRLVLWTMMGAVTLVLLIACANVANLMLARASARQREFSVRAAIGAGRARLVKQLLTECVLLGLAAAPVGVAIVYVGVWLLDGAVPADNIPYFIHWEISPRVLGYTAIVSALTGVVFGLAPASQAGRLNLNEALREGGRGSGTSGRRARVRHTLVVVEVALALVLLVGASLFVRSFLNLQAASPGFDTSPLLTLRVYLTGQTYATDASKAQRMEDIMRRLEALPSVQAAFASNFVPLGGGGGDATIVVDGRTAARGEEPRIGFTAVTPHMYKTVGLSVINGRDFTDAEGGSRTPVAVINETMAAKLWASSDPVGARFRLVDADPAEWFTVIGVAPDLRRVDMNNDTPPQPVAYVPYPYGPTPNTGITIRAAGDPAAITSAVRAEIRASDPGIPLFSIRTMEDLRVLGFWQFRVFGWMFGIFGAAALFLAAIGVYGVLSFAVSQRTQEIGVRMALGAERRDVLRLVVRQGATLALIGIAAGLVVAFGVTRVIGTLLYNVTPTDPVSFGGVAFFLAAVACLASYLPARRAMGVDPIVALRNE